MGASCATSSISSSTPPRHEVQVAIKKANGLDDLVVFEKEIDEDLGIEFERATWDDVTLCNNNCFFCFLKGLPKGMRKTLYVKDDDYRLSFLHGNFVTLTNLDEADWERLEEQRLSPLNVSVHATDLELRRHMLEPDGAGHRRAAPPPRRRSASARTRRSCSVPA